MLTKIIFRACILVVLTTVFACVPDESAMPKVEADALLMTNETANLQPLENAHARIISQENQPTACIYEDCSTLLPALYATYRDLANETCKEQWYCATCCLEDQITEIQAYVEPDSENCLAAVGQDVASALPIPNLTVAILPNHCLMGGTMLWAVNPKKPGTPPYSQPTFTVKWFRNGQLIGTGVLLSECVCGENVTVKVHNTVTGAQGSAVFVAPKCAVEG